MGLFGAQYRGPKNQYAALNYHGYSACRMGRSTRASRTAQACPQPTVAGDWAVYEPDGADVALGGSVDFNVKKNWRSGFRRI